MTYKSGFYEGDKPETQGPNTTDELIALVENTAVGLTIREYALNEIKLLRALLRLAIEQRDAWALTQPYDRADMTADNAALARLARGEGK